MKAKREYNPLVIDMAGLTRLERALLRLHGNGGVPVGELAEAFGVPPGRVRRLLRRARRRYGRCSRRLGVR